MLFSSFQDFVTVNSVLLSTGGVTGIKVLVIVEPSLVSVTLVV
ncbi:hypothetical protein [Companilactobacillus bobalius]|nr:hypothetical protein [Companilactobacillus bobalius]